MRYPNGELNYTNQWFKFVWFYFLMRVFVAVAVAGFVVVGIVVVAVEPDWMMTYIWTVFAALAAVAKGAPASSAARALSPRRSAIPSGA